MGFTSIPPSLFEEEAIHHLDLSYNALKFSEDISRLVSKQGLLSLDISNNPLEFFMGSSSSLESLSLASSQLKSFPLLLIPTLTFLNLNNNSIGSVFGDIANLQNLLFLCLGYNEITHVCDEIGQLKKLRVLNLSHNQLSKIPSINGLTQLQELNLSNNQLTTFPEILKLRDLVDLALTNNQISSIPDEIKQLSKLKILSIENNPLEAIPKSLAEINELELIYISLPQLPLIPLSFREKNNLLLGCAIERISDGEKRFLNIGIPKYLWGVPFEQWRSQWLLEEENTEIRRILIEQIGYDKICTDLDAELLDEWREYCLLKIPNIDIEDVYLLKMICPSTGHIHAVRVPPTVASAQEAITWINYGILPDSFKVQT